MACAASLIPPVVKVAFDSAPAKLGTSAHEILARVVTDDFVPWSEVPKTAARHGVDEGELRHLAHAGAKLWMQVRDHFSGPTAVELYGERRFVGGSFPDIALTGTRDVVTFRDDEAIVADWKTGYLDDDYADQLMGYSAITLGNLKIERVVTYVLWVRTGEIEQRTVTRAQSDEWLATLHNHVSDTSTHRPGSHCRGCPRWGECEAATRHYQEATAILLGRSLPALDDASAVELYQAAAKVESQARLVREHLRAQVTERGPITSGGTTLTLATEERRSVDAAKAWDILCDALGARTSEAVKISLSEACDIIASRTERGQKKAAIQAFVESLDAAGAISKNVITKLVSRRAQ
jgi:hypothetical protein